MSAPGAPGAAGGSGAPGAGSELLRVVAAVFRHQPRERLGRNEFKQFLAFRLNWYPPAMAAQVLDRALAAGLLRAEGDEVRAAFDVHAVELPVAFRGSMRALEEPLPAAPAPGAAAPPAAGSSAAHAPAAAALPRDPALEERARALRELSGGALSDQAAGLLAARERGADVRGAAAQALAALQGPAGPDANVGL